MEIGELQPLTGEVSSLKCFIMCLSLFNHKHGISFKSGCIVPDLSFFNDGVSESVFPVPLVYFLMNSLASGSQIANTVPGHNVNWLT